MLPKHAAHPSIRRLWLPLLLSLSLVVAGCGSSDGAGDEPGGDSAEGAADGGDGAGGDGEGAAGDGEGAAGDATEDDAGAGGADLSDTTLVIGGWGGAINEATESFYLQPFTEETGAAWEFVDAPGTQLAAVEAQFQANNVTWDAIDSVPADAAFTLHQRGYLEPLPDDLRAELEEVLGEGKVTEFGFTHANVGNVIACNMERMDTCPASIDEFFDVEAFPQSRMMGGVGPVFTVTMAMVASGTPATETATTPVDMDQAFAALEEVKPAVTTFWQTGDQQLQIMRSGEVDMGIMWSGRAYALAAEGMDLEINWTGGAYEPSYWAVVKDAPNKDAAFEFLRWLAHNAEAQAQWATELHYSVPNPDATAHIPEEVVPELADTPENFSEMAIPNFAWYAEHSEALNSAYAEFLRG